MRSDGIHRVQIGFRYRPTGELGRRNFLGSFADTARAISVVSTLDPEAASAEQAAASVPSMKDPRRRSERGAPSCRGSNLPRVFQVRRRGQHRNLSPDDIRFSRQRTGDVPMCHRKASRAGGSTGRGDRIAEGGAPRRRVSCLRDDARHRRNYHKTQSTSVLNI
jgi:hypothetical protein